MEMQSSRGRSLDSTRPAGLKKPRLTEEPQRDRPTNTVIPVSAGRSRPFPPRASSASAQLSDPRIRAADREMEPRDDSFRGATYQQQQQMQELVAQYKTALAELTFNSKPIITNLTIIAGENLHAAKGIVATICTNILEVPSDQKLPSLYLLDSIVKNIGRDYIKYFAVRLPEVFCKAYNQVDSSIHPGMRHLFGTWKGVFPSTTLQFIEKELGFSSAINGSVTTTSRSDSQTQRPPHSIHVNPKYLEARQLLQQSTQSSQSKVVSNNSADSMEDAVEQPQRPGKTPSSGSMKQWIDPPLVKGIQRPLKEPIREIVPKKNPGIYGDSEFTVDTSRKSDLKFGRDRVVSDQAGLDSTWYGLGSSTSEASVNKKIGSNISRTHESYSSLRSSQAISQKVPLDQRITSKSDQLSSRNWKNSEEEEYLWDDMNSKLSDHGGSSLTRAGWDSDEMEKPASIQRVKYTQTHSNKSSTIAQWEKTCGEDVRAPPFRETEEYSQSDSQHDGRFRAKIEASSESPSSFGGSRNLSMIHDQDPPVVTAFGHTNTVSKNFGPFEEHQIPRVRETSKLISSISAKDGVTPLSDISITTYPSSLGPSLTPPVSQFSSLQKPHGISTREYEHTQLYSQTIPSTLSQVNQVRSSKILSDTFSKNSQNQTTQSQHSQNLQSPISESPFIKETPPAPLSHLVEMRNHLPFLQQSRPDQSLQRTGLQQSQLSSEVQKQLGGPSLTNNSNNLEVNLGAAPSVSNLLAAFLQSGILSKDVTNVNSQPPLPSGPPPPRAVVSSSSEQSSFGSGTMSYVDILPPAVNAKTTIQPPSPVLPHATDKSASSQNPLSSLLSSLVAKGLISSTSEAQANTIQAGDQQPNQMESISTSTSMLASSIPDSAAISTSKMSTIPESPEATKHEEAAPLKDLVGIEFKSEVIRGFHPVVINSLFDDLKHQCGICGLRFQLSESLRKHLDWHDSKVAESRSLNQISRKWFVDSNPWITGAFEALSEPEDNFLEETVLSSEKNEPMVPADERQSICALCGEPFEDYYSFSRDEWMYRGTIHLTKPNSKKETAYVDGHQTSDLIVHSKCYQQNPVEGLESA